jgi:hypothetical protein
MGVDLYINQGTDWANTVTFQNDDQTPVDLTGFTFASSFRTSYYTANTSGNLSISVLDAVNGNALISMNSAASSNVASGRYYYDAIMIDTFGNVTRILEGILTIKPGVTVT